MVPLSKFYSFTGGTGAISFRTQCIKAWYTFILSYIVCLHAKLEVVRSCCKYGLFDAILFASVVLTLSLLLASKKPGRMQ